MGVAEEVVDACSWRGACGRDDLQLQTNRDTHQARCRRSPRHHAMQEMKRTCATIRGHTVFEALTTESNDSHSARVQVAVLIPVF